MNPDETQLARLERALDRLLRQRDPSERRGNDPVDIVWEYDRRADREVAALVTSSLAYGRVELLKQAAREALAPLGERPARFLLEHPVPTQAYGEFVYRMSKGPDVIDLLTGIQRALREYGSLEAMYLDGSERVDTPDDHLEHASRFVRTLRTGRRRDDLARGLRYLLPDPADGSACKRLHMFFRWMGRPRDGVDLDLWDGLDPAALLMPLDTHTSRMCRYIGLTDRKSVDGKMARLVTDSLRALDPQDPTKYDFALCHLGMSEACIHERSEEHCPQCPIEGICTLE